MKTKLVNIIKNTAFSSIGAINHSSISTLVSPVYTFSMPGNIIVYTAGQGTK